MEGSEVEIYETLSSSTTEEEDMEEDIGEDDDEDSSGSCQMESFHCDNLFIKSFQNMIESAGLVCEHPPLERNMSGKRKGRTNEILEMPAKRNNEGNHHHYPVPLKLVKVEAALVHVVAQVQLTQIYKNDEDLPINAIYYFPVDSNGAVTHFQAEVDGQVVKSVVKARGNENHEAAPSNRIMDDEDGIVLIGEERKPDIFKASIGEVKPGQEVKIVVGYVTEAKNDADTHTVRFFLPTAITPRRFPTAKMASGNFSIRNKEVLELKMTDEPVTPLSIKVIVSIQGKIKSVESPTHKICVDNKGEISQKPTWYKAIITLEGLTTDMDRDFVLLIKPEEPMKPRLYAETLPNGSNAVMTYFVPSFKLHEQKVELIFIIDRSESMSGRNIEIAKAVLKLLLQSMPADCHFNVVGFGSHHHCLFKSGSKRCNDQTLKDATNYCNKIQPDMGGTEFIAPLQKIYEESLIPGYFKQMFVITDGAVCDTDILIGLVRMNVHISRIFTLGIGNASSHHVLESMAKAGNGTCAFIESDASVHKQTLGQLKNALQPSLTDAKIEWEGVKLPESPERTLDGYNKAKNMEMNQSIFISSPRKLPPIFDGTQILIFGLFSEGVKPKEGKIIVDSPDGPLTLILKLSEENDLGATKMLHRLAAIKIVRELELEECAIRLLSRPRREPELARIKEKILQIAVSNGISSKYTSFVGVDGRSRTFNWSTRQLRNVPLQFPFGYSAIRDGLCHLKCCGKSCRMRQERIRTIVTRDSPQYPENGGGKRPLTIGTIGNICKTRRKPSPTKKVRRESDTDIEPMDTTTMEDVKVHGHTLLQNLISCQRSEGFFTLNPAFAIIISLELTKLIEESKMNQWDEKVWATILAIRFFKVKLTPFKDLWDSPVAKSQKWIVQNHLNSTDTMIARAEVLLK